MERKELDTILAEHAKWRLGDGGKRAYLSGAYLSRANLSRADLSGANLSHANLYDADLSGANLSHANLYGANLSRANLSGASLSHANLYGADLSGANLSGANLSDAYLTRANLSHADLSGANLSHANLYGADLSRADLSGANLSDTCLAPNLHDLARAFARACPADPDGRRIVYRTAQSQHIGSAIYEPGKTYDAPYLSWDAATACHPGIYAGSLEWIKANYPGERLVKCAVYDGDWTITAKGAIRTAHLEVIENVED